MLIVRTLLALAALLGADNRADTPPRGPFDIGVTTAVVLDSSRMDSGHARQIFPQLLLHNRPALVYERLDTISR